MAIVLDKAGVRVRPTGAALAADVEGIDLAGALSPETMAAIKKAWGDNLVLRFRGQSLGDDDLMRFSRQFGELDWAPVAATNDAPEGKEYVMVVSNVVENGQAIGQLGSYEALWHTDMSYIAEPPMASALYSIEAPPSGGDTGFCNMYLALETLPADLRRAVEGRTCIHDASRNSAGELRRGYVDAPDATQTVGAAHPIVRTHPQTGRKALFLGRRRNAYVAGLSLADSEELLDALWAHATKDEFAWYQQWRAGDLILWDNRCVMHRRDAFDPATRRVMHRTQIKGRSPILNHRPSVGGQLGPVIGVLSHVYEVDHAGPQVAGSEITAVDHPVEVDGRLARGVGAVAGDHAERHTLGVSATAGVQRND